MLGAEVELRRSEYDTESAVAAIRGATGPVHDQLSSWLLEPPDQDETTAYFEGVRTQRSGS